jgi:4-hydroxybenzoate polyprenyltransferase
MNFYKIFYIFLFFHNKIYDSLIIKKISNKSNINRKYTLNIYNNNQLVAVKQKTNNFLRLIRYKNIPSTFLLSLSSNYIINNSIIELFQSKIFIASSIITILIMSSSMIINDIFDIDIDKINNSDRPLVSGDIKIHEAIMSAFIMLGLTKYLSIKYLTKNLQIIINIIIFIIIIYTPILKKILFIKNLSCALLVSFSTYFTGLSCINQCVNINAYINIYIFYLLSTFIFLGSLYNELLLDIIDKDGDKHNNINTIPVVYGLNNSWNLAKIILYFNILFNSFNLCLIFGIREGMLLFYILYPLKTDLDNIKKSNYNNNIINYAVNKLNKPLFLSLIYLCVLSKK